MIKDIANTIGNFLSEEIRSLPSPLVEDFGTLLYVVSSYFANSKISANNFVSMNFKKHSSVIIYNICKAYKC